MTPELESLVKIGQLKKAKASQAELDGLLSSGEVRLRDSRNAELALPSRFDLAYNAAHALALTALRRLGYRSENRHTVFSALAHTLGMDASVIRVLLKCHVLRNQSEYEGHLEVDERLVEDLIRATEKVRTALSSKGS